MSKPIFADLGGHTLRIDPGTAIRSSRVTITKGAEYSSETGNLIQPPVTIELWVNKDSLEGMRDAIDEALFIAEGGERHE